MHSSLQALRYPYGPMAVDDTTLISIPESITNSVLFLRVLVECC